MKRKVDVENRLFNDEWTDKYAFIMPTVRYATPCSQTVAVAKEHNLQRHHNRKSEARQGKIATLQSAYSHAS